MIRTALIVFFALSVPAYADSTCGGKFGTPVPDWACAPWSPNAKIVEPTAEEQAEINRVWEDDSRWPVYTVAEPSAAAR